MREEIKIKNTPKDQLINNIIDIEWFLFDNVNNQGGRAWCQNDEWAFYVNRYSQFNAMSMETLGSYKADLDQALKEGRNVLTEKYAYMMEFTDPQYYKEYLKDNIPTISEEKAKLVDSIAELLVEYEKKFEKMYPKFSSKGREIDGASGYASFKVYAIGELKTYSVNTLVLYLGDIIRMGSENKNISVEIHGTTARLYGYESIEAAEAKM